MKLLKRNWGRKTPHNTNQYLLNEVYIFSDPFVKSPNYANFSYGGTMIGRVIIWLNSIE